MIVSLFPVNAIWVNSYGRSGEEYRGVCPNDVQARRLVEQGRHGWTDQ